MFSSCLWLMILTFFNTYHFFHCPPRLFALRFINFVSEAVITILSFVLISSTHSRIKGSVRLTSSLYRYIVFSAFFCSAILLPAYQPSAHPPCDDVTWCHLCLPILVTSFPPTPGTQYNSLVIGVVGVEYYPTRFLRSAPSTALWTDRNSVLGFLR
jgi:hypothetical protein